MKRITVVYESPEQDEPWTETFTGLLIREDMAVFKMGLDEEVLVVKGVKPTGDPLVYKTGGDMPTIFDYEPIREDYPLEWIPDMSAIDFMLTIKKGED